MQISKNEWESLMEYQQKKLVAECRDLEGTKGLKKFITDTTIIGILQSITIDQFIAETGTKKERKKAVINDDKFKEIWDAYPASASFEYRGTKFNSSRVLRANKAACEMLYSRAIIENTVTFEQILSAIKKQVQLVKEESYESGQNKMQYLPALEVYLRQARYEAFIGVDSEEVEGYNEANNNCA